MSHDQTLEETEGAADSSREPPWAWATEHGAPEWAAHDQLLCWLGAGELPPHTLVWRAGWGEWLPAWQVRELAAAFPRVTPGSRRVARAAPGAVAPPSVPIAHYPRLRLLARDVLNESPLPPLAAPVLVPAPAERRALQDRERQQQELVTSQVPAAAMLERARAMRDAGALPARSSAERWSRLELGSFAAPRPAAAAPVARTLPPLALELGFPALLEPERAPAPPRVWQRFAPWLVVGALVGSVLGLLRAPAPDEAVAAEPALALDTVQHSLSVAAASVPAPAPARPAPSSAAPVAEEAEPAVLRVGELPARRSRALPPAARSGPSRLRSSAD